MTNYEQYKDPEARKEYERQYRLEHRERQREYMCQWRLDHPDKIKGYNARWWRENREQHYANSKRWREANPEKILARDQRYKAANPEKVRALQKRWVDEHPDRIKAIRQKWEGANPEKVQAKRRQHGAKRRGAPGKFTADDWRALVARSPHCHWCKRRFNKNRHRTLDHVIPLSKGGTHSPENAVCSCSPCNSTKHDRLIDPVTGQGLLL